MINIAIIVLDIIGPCTVLLYLYILYYLWTKKVISLSQLPFDPLFWPQLIFKFRDLSKKETGKISCVYFAFLFSLSALIIALLFVVIPELMKMPVPAMVFVGLALFLILPIVVYIFLLMSREKYY